MKWIEEFTAFCTDKSIVVVGNGNSLLDRQDGEKIDAFDIVVRINHGYPRPETMAATGKKTSVWVCAFNNRDLQLPVYKEMNPVYALRLNNRTHIHPAMEKVLLSWDMKEWDRTKAKTGVADYPSTGLVTLDFLVDFIGCPNVAIAGFDHFRYNNFYHGKREPNSAAKRWHDPELEQRYIENMEHTGRVTRL